MKKYKFSMWVMCLLCCSYLFSALSQPVLAADGFPSYYQNPSAERIIADLKAHNPGLAHPRLFLRAASLEQLKAKLQMDPLMRAWYQKLKEEGDRVVREAVGTPTLYDRQQMRSASGAKRRIEIPAFLYLISGEEKYRDRAIREIETVIRFPDWNHDKVFLNTAELAAAVAVGYDWLYNELSADLRREIRTALVEKALKKVEEAYAANVFWYKKGAMVSNWNAVCNGGVAVAALAIGDECPEIAGDVLAAAIPSLESSILMQFVPDGGWVEGLGYWHYMIEYVAKFLAALESATGTLYGMENTPGLIETAYFPVYMTGPKSSFNYGDSSDKKMKITELFWLARKLNSPALMKAGLDLLREAGDFGGVYDFLWYEPTMAATAAPELNLDKYFRKTEVFTMRSGWQDPYACFVGFKGGKTYNSHAHMDVGSFVFQAAGETWVEDLGPDRYTDAYISYSGSRYYYYRGKAEGHNTIVINPDGTYQQDYRSENVIEKTESKPRGAFAILNMTEAYSKNVLSARRGVMLTHNREIFVVQDQIRLRQPSTVYWFAHTTANVSIRPDGKSLVMSKNGKKLWLQIISPGQQSLRFQVGPAAPLPSEPVMADQADNSKYQRVFITGQAASDFELAVAFIPLKGSDTPDFVPAYAPLEAWAISDGPVVKPVVTDISLDGLPLANFSAERSYYDIALPAGTQKLPVISATGAFPVDITPPQDFLQPALITVRDPQNSQNINRYVLRFYVLPGHSQPVNGQKAAIRQVMASTYQNQPDRSQVNPPEHAVDGSRRTAWAAEGNEWLSLELEQAAIVESVAIGLTQGDNRIFPLEIEISADGQSWQTVYRGTNTGLGTAIEYFTFPPTSAKYVRIQGQGNSQNRWNVYYEVEVWVKPAA